MTMHRTILCAALLLSLPSLAFAERGFQAADLVSMDRYSSPVLSPNGRQVVFARRVVDMDANKASSSLWIEDLFARDALPPKRLTPEGWNVNSPAFSADGKSVYFLSGKSGRSQLYSIALDGGEPVQVTDFALDIDAYSLSPDGKRIAFAASAFADCKGDMDCSRNRLDATPKASGVVYDRMFIRHWDTWANGSLNRIFTAAIDGKSPVKAATLVGADLIADVPSKPFGDLSDLAWAPDGKSLVVSARLSNGDEPTSTNFDLYRIAADGSGKATRAIADGSIGSFSIAGPSAVFTRNSMKSGNQVVAGGIDGEPERAITPSASEMLPDVAFGKYEQFSFKGWNGDTVHGYVVKPWNYQEGKTYPVAFLIHGGPQGSFGDGWSYRWNPQTYAGQGYAVVMIDFHGSTGYGQAFTDAISQHWGDRPLEDLQKGWASAQQQYAFLDGANACALGASYGGYMVYWIAGNWHTPESGAWKCLVDHDGVFDNRMMGYATEELWFSEWENGGTPYDNPEGYEKFNPINHVKEWRVPMLVVHGQHDYRIPVEQGIAAFTALQRQGIESKFLYFPDENHWVLKPANSLLWHDTVNAWLGAHIGAGAR